MNRLHAAALLIAALAVLAACSGAKQTPASPTGTAAGPGTETSVPATSTPVPSRTATPTPTPTPTATPSMPEPRAYYPWQPLGTRSGDPEIDPILAAFESGDVAALVGLTAFETYACEAPRPQSPQPRLCPDGIDAGTMIEGFPVSHVEGGLLSPEDMAAFWSTWNERWYSTLYGVFEMPGDPPVLHILFAPPSVSPQAFDTVVVEDGRMTSVTFQFTSVPLDGLFDPSVPLWLLPPLPSVPAERFTTAHEVAARLAAGELLALFEEGSPTAYRCSGGSPQLPGGLIAEYSSLCRGVPDGEFREGFTFGIHGSHGGPRIAEDAVAEITRWEEPGPWKLLTAGCPVADWECEQFAVAFGTGDGLGLHAMYFTFDASGGEPVLTGAAISGDNAAAILQSGVTMTTIGELHFFPVPAP